MVFSYRVARDEALIVLLPTIDPGQLTIAQNGELRLQFPCRFWMNPGESVILNDAAIDVAFDGQHWSRAFALTFAKNDNARTPVALPATLTAADPHSTALVTLASAPGGPLPASSKGTAVIHLSFEGVDRVNLSAPIEFDASNGSVVFGRVRRSDRVFPMILHGTLWLLLPIVLVAWSRGYYGKIHGVGDALWRPWPSVLSHVAAFVAGFVGLPAWTAIPKSVPQLMSLSAFPELQLGAQTVRVLKTRWVFGVAALLAVALVVFMGAHHSSPLPAAPPLESSKWYYDAESGPTVVANDARAAVADLVRSRIYAAYPGRPGLRLVTLKGGWSLLAALTDRPATADFSTITIAVDDAELSLFTKPCLPRRGVVTVSTRVLDDKRPCLNGVVRDALKAALANRDHAGDYRMVFVGGEDTPAVRLRKRQIVDVDELINAFWSADMRSDFMNSTKSFSPVKAADELHVQAGSYVSATVLFEFVQRMLDGFDQDVPVKQAVRLALICYAAELSDETYGAMIQLGNALSTRLNDKKKPRLGADVIRLWLRLLIRLESRNVGRLKPDFGPVIDAMGSTALAAYMQERLNANRLLQGDPYISARRQFMIALCTARVATDPSFRDPILDARKAASKAEDRAIYDQCLKTPGAPARVE